MSVNSVTPVGGAALVVSVRGAALVVSVRGASSVHEPATTVMAATATALRRRRIRARYASSLVP
jgi:hypothetical protein